jgi:P4 family phage/plasmid primase-like protien
MEVINEERCEPPLTEAEIKKKCEQAERYPIGQALSRIQSEAVVIDWEHIKNIKYSDLDDARRFAKFAYGKIAYTETRGGLKYSEGVWISSKNAAASIIGDFADLEYDFAVSVCNKAKENEEMQPFAKECLKHAWKLRKKSTVDAIISLSKPYLTLPDELFDAKPEELNTPGGVVDLRTGSIRPACPDDYFTQSASVSPTCTNEDGAMWSEMLERLTGGDIAFIRFLQMAAGMIAVGKVYQENCLFAVGSGRNGKSTFFNALFRVLGSYATSIDPEVLLANKQNREVLLAGIRGKRFVLASETEEGVRLSSSALKRITSTDPIAAKQLYKDPMTFTHTHTLVLYTNHLPKVGSTDGGTWNRIKVVPFKAKWADNGKGTVLNYCDVLVTKAGGDILSWMIEGARQYFAAGCKLSEPLVMQAASAEYKTSEDWFQNFIDDCCKTGPNYRIRTQELYEHYRYWAKTNGEYIRRRNDFYTALEGNGYSIIIPQNIKTCVGIMVTSGLGFG